MKDFPLLKFENFLFYGFVVLCILPILANPFFITGDGPAHLYNSKVLLDYFSGEGRDFYNNFYLLNRNLEPNLLSHICLAALMLFFSSFTAEKIFIITYIVLLPVSFRFAIKSIHKESIAFSWLIFPFIYHFSFQSGYYNFSYGIIFFFLSIVLWNTFKKDITLNRTLLMALFYLIFYFVHPVAFAYSTLVIFLSLAFNYKQKDYFADTLKKYILFLLPAATLFAAYFYRKGLQLVPPYEATESLTSLFFRITSLTLFDPKEEIIVLIFSLLFWSGVLYLLTRKIKSRKININDAYLFAFIISLIIYYHAPGGLTGAGITKIRLQFFPYLILMLWLASFSINKVLQHFIILISIIGTSALLYIRMPYYEQISENIQELIPAEKFIKNNSTVLYLSFQDYGIDKDKSPITNRIDLFMHAGDYIGINKNVVMLNNYEATTNWFPLMWKENKNPYLVFPNYTFENNPEQVNPKLYEIAKDAKVGYVLLFGFENDSMKKNRFINTLKVNYKLIYKSPKKMFELYQEI